MADPHKVHGLPDDMQPGATGSYPDGKIGPGDEGELRVAVSTDLIHQRIRVDFGKMLSWVSMTPEQAIQFAEVLRQRAVKMLS